MSVSSGFTGLFLTTAQYVFWMVLSLNNSFIRDNALLVFAKITMPDTGLSKRCHTPQNTLPGLLSRCLIKFFTFSDKGISPVLSPCTISDDFLLITIK